MPDRPADEHSYLLVMASGDQAIRTYARSGSGSFALVPAAQTGLAASGTGVACTVGDFDNDGLPDVAVAMSDRVLLFKNHGGGKFTEVTAAAGLQPANHPAGITFVDYDHDGDLDLFRDGIETQRSVAQQRQRHLYQLDGASGPGRRRHNCVGDPV